jgi:sugar phosphate isomerase/epimerase
MIESEVPGMNCISQTVPYQYNTVFSPYTVDNLPLVLDELRQKGFTGVEYAVAYPERVNRDQLNRMTELYGLPVTTLSTGQTYGLEGANFTSADSERRKRAQDIINGHIDLSKEIGTPPVTVGLLRGKGRDGDLAVLLHMFREALLPCVEYAETKGVRLQIEPICKEETLLINTIDEGREFLHRLGNPAHVGLLYDTYHSWRGDSNMADAIRAAGSHIFNIHFSDSNRGLPGTGEIDFRQVMDAIRKTAYQGAFALETKCVPSAEYVLAHDGESIRRIVL